MAEVLEQWQGCQQLWRSLTTLLRQPADCSLARQLPAEMARSRTANPNPNPNPHPHPHPHPHPNPNPGLLVAELMDSGGLGEAMLPLAARAVRDGPSPNPNSNP